MSTKPMTTFARELSIVCALALGASRCGDGMRAPDGSSSTDSSGPGPDAQSFDDAATMSRDAGGNVPDAFAPVDVTTPMVDAGAPPSCSAPLAARAIVTDLSDVMPASCASFRPPTTSSVLCMRIAGARDGSVRFAYADQRGMVRVLTIDALGRRGAGELRTMGEDVRAVYAHEGGDVSVLVKRGIVLALVRFAADGRVLSDQGVIGTMGMSAEGTRWADNALRAAAIEQSGANTTYYSSVSGNFGARGIHQGDQLRHVSPSGMIQAGGWDWGCSHSFELRLASGPMGQAAVCVSDAYPSPGIVLNNRTVLVPEPAWNPGGGVRRVIVPLLGGVVPDGNGFFLSFASADGRAARDVAILRFEGTTAATRRWFTTGAANNLAFQPDLMRLGTGMLAYWEWLAGSEASAHLQELDATGAPVGAPLRLLATDASHALAFRGGEVPAISIPGGDAAWVGYRSGTSGPLRLVRMRACR